MQVWALNEAQVGSVRSIFRPWAERLDISLPTLDSNDDDPELLIHVPFTGSVKIKVKLPALFIHQHIPLRWREVCTTAALGYNVMVPSMYEPAYMQRHTNHG